MKQFSLVKTGVTFKFIDLHFHGKFATLTASTRLM